MYMPGHAGNFLARLFSLGPETVPQMTRESLDQQINQIDHTGNPDRLASYAFTHALKFDSWQEFHRVWADYYQNWQYALYNALLQNRHDVMVYAIHPHEFAKFETTITNDHSNNQYFYVDLQPKYTYWAVTQQRKLQFFYRDHELYQFNEFQKKYEMQRIDLTAILDTTETFQEEYTRCCEIMGLASCPDLALSLYQEWIAIRK